MDSQWYFSMSLEEKFSVDVRDQRVNQSAENLYKVGFFEEPLCLSLVTEVDCELLGKFIKR